MHTYARAGLIMSLICGIALVAILVLFGPKTASAQDETGMIQSYNTAGCTGKFCPLAQTPGGSRLGDLYGTTSLGSFINKLFVAALSLGAILAVLRLAFAGYLYMTTDAWGTKGKAKEVIGDVVIGLLLLLSIWLILRQINPQLLDLNVLKNLKPLPAVQQQQPAAQQTQTNSNINGFSTSGGSTGEELGPQAP